MNIDEKEKFVQELHGELKVLDFDYERIDDGRRYDAEKAWHDKILSKIESVDDIELQDIAITLYNIHSLNNGGRLEIDWETYLQK